MFGYAKNLPDMYEKEMTNVLKKMIITSFILISVNNISKSRITYASDVIIKYKSGREAMEE
jgi:hypothetical protein